MDVPETAPTPLTDRLLDLVSGNLRSVPPEVDWSSASLTDLGLDSMTAIELVIGIEDAFGIQFPEHLLVRETFATFPALQSAVRSVVEA